MFKKNHQVNVQGLLLMQLILLGYKLIDCSKKSAGTILVIKKSAKHEHGHIEILGAMNKYYSDFKQRSDCPYSDGCGTPRCYMHN